jgi:large subunit ribosomal protein L24
MKKIQTGDTAIVTAWKNKWAIAQVIRVDEDSVFLKWVNIVKKAKKQQWFVEKEWSIHISNVSLYDPTTKKPARVKISEEKWKKVRLYVGSNTIVKKAA